MLLVGESHTVMFILLTHVCIAYHNSFKLFIGISKYETASILSGYALCLMYNAAKGLLGIWCIHLCVDVIALLTIL